MTTFHYIGRSAAGERREGALEAPDRRAALLRLDAMGLVPVTVREQAAPGAPAAPARRHPLRTTRRARLKRREVLLLTRELSDLLGSGMTLGRALHTLAGRRTGRAQDVVIRTLRDAIVQGANLSDALQQWPETFPSLYISMIRAGEAGGQLAAVLLRLAEHYERVEQTREKVLAAMIYPAIVLCAGLGTMVFTMVFVVPRFSAIFEELGSTLPLPTRMLIAISGFLLHYGWLLLLLLLAALWSGRRYLRTAAGRRAWHRLQLKLPLVRPIVEANAFTHFARTLGSLLQNGVPVLQALGIVEQTVGNTLIAEAVHEAREQVTDGASISGPLAAGRVFPALLTDMLAVGEETGDLPASLAHIAHRYENELDRRVKLMTSVLEPLLILVIAVLVGFIAVSMLLAVFDLTSGLRVG